LRATLVDDESEKNSSLSDSSELPIFSFSTDTYAVDGFFATTRSRFGCPTTNAATEFISCPFPPDAVGLNPYSPTSALSSSSVNTKNTIILSPALYLQDRETPPFSFFDLVSLALQPPTQSIKKKVKSGQSREVYDKLYQMGIATVDSWHSSTKEK